MRRKTNVIEWKNPRPDDIVWQYPDEEIRWGSILIVHEYETAMFLRDGKIYDVVLPGRHMLETQNLPLLTSAYKLIMGLRESPFKATVIFVSLKQFKGKFGLKTRTRLSPRSSWMTELQAYGEYWFKVEDPSLFLTQIIGSTPSLSTPDVSNFIRSFFIQQFMQEFGKLDVMTAYKNLEDISLKIKSSLDESFRQRGLRLLDLKLAGLNTPLLERMEQADPTYGLALIAAIQEGNEDKVLEITRTVESMRAIGKAGGAGIGAALVAIPQLLGQQQANVQSKHQREKSPIEKLRDLKQMLDEGLITREEYESTKKEILKEMT